jgi:hypothetical protein
MPFVFSLVVLGSGLNGPTTELTGAQTASACRRRRQMEFGGR